MANVKYSQMINAEHGRYKHKLSGLHGKMYNLPRSSKKIILISVDYFLYGLALLSAFYLRLGSVDYNHLASLIPLFLLVGFAGVVVGWWVGLYKTVIRSLEFQTVNLLLASTLVTSLLIASYGYVITQSFIPRSIPLIFIMVAIAFIGSSRVFIRWYYRYLLGLNNTKENVLIYGAGDAGNHVAAILSNSPEIALVGFIDDAPSLKGLYMRGRKIYSFDQIDRLINRLGKFKILLCINDLSLDRKKTIVQNIQSRGLEIDIVPSLVDIIAGHMPLDQIRPIEIQDLLGREPVQPISDLFEKALLGKTIFISGAGGSIGSEICIQCIKNKAARIIMFDNSELAIYKLEQLVTKIIDNEKLEVDTHFHIGSVTDRSSVARIIKSYVPNIVYHAAAFKHVPIVEKNILEGVRNNVLGTQIVASESIKAEVERFILVSTDKAVRPTSIMGATKRMAELVLKAYSQKSSKTIFSMVRFGNVLESSGSVIPLFKSQIEKGGPITVTHRDITRYFMTISEAAQLVIQSGFLANSNEIFLLDMGEPVYISELAELMIRLSGSSVKNEKNPMGDIEIQYTGLRPGEKLYEELLINNNAQGTMHPKIMMAQDEMSNPPDFLNSLKDLERFITANKPDQVIKILQKFVEDYQPSGTSKKSPGTGMTT